MHSYPQAAAASLHFSPHMLAESLVNIQGDSLQSWRLKQRYLKLLSLLKPLDLLPTPHPWIQHVHFVCGCTSKGWRVDQAVNLLLASLILLLRSLCNLFHIPANR